jgi:Domain of unknown function (DUF4407)
VNTSRTSARSGLPARTDRCARKGRSIVRRLRTESDQAGSAAAVANATHDLPAALVKLHTDEAEQANLEASFNKQNAVNAGLLLRLQALDQAAAGSSTLEAARWLLFLFFTAIECLPILVKVLLNLGPENTYEQALAIEERANLRFSAQETARQYRAAVLEGDALYAQSELVDAEWRRAIPRIVRDTAAARERVARKSIAHWEKHAMAGALNIGGNQPGDWRGAQAAAGTGARIRMQSGTWSWRGLGSRIRRATGRHAAWLGFRRPDPGQHGGSYAAPFSPNGQ